MTEERGRDKLAPPMLYGLMEKNYSEQFTAWISKGGNNRRQSDSQSNLTAHGFVGVIYRGEKSEALTTPWAFAFREHLFEDKEQDCSPDRWDRVYQRV